MPICNPCKRCRTGTVVRRLNGDITCLQCGHVEHWETGAARPVAVRKRAKPAPPVDNDWLPLWRPGEIPPGLISLREAAVRYGISRQRAYRWMLKGDLRQMGWYHDGKPGGARSKVVVTRELLFYAKLPQKRWESVKVQEM